MDKWIPITTDIEAERLLTLFGEFHDSCIREAHIWTGHFVSPDLSMSCDGGLDTCVNFLVQRQFRDPSCIELRFEQVTRINVVPTPVNYNSVIHNATLIVHGDGITWALDLPESKLEEIDSSQDTWVTAKVLKYRVADELLGPLKRKYTDTID